MAPPGWIDWRKCKSKHIILEDLCEGVIPLTDEEATAEEIWETWYKNMVEFIEEEIVFDQFKERLAAHREQVTKKKVESMRQLELLRHHQSLHPQKTRDHKGQLIFDMHPAKELLRQDVKMNKHKTMSPAALRATQSEYGEFTLDIFRQRIYQEVRRQKFIYFLNWARAAKRCKRFEGFSNSETTHNYNNMDTTE